MKRMTFMMAIVLTVVGTSFGEAYDPAKHGNPIVVTNGTVEIDGQGAVIDGQGQTRCATLGPNVTLKNFTLRNGSADWGGGVLGGRLVGCTIEKCTATLGGGAYGADLTGCTIAGCTATESGAALGDCTATRCRLTGNTRPTSAATAGAFGGIAFDSVLTDCTLEGNRADFGSQAPAFGGVGARLTLTRCTVKNNVVQADEGVCYGRILAYSTVDGVAADFRDDEKAVEPGPKEDPKPDLPDVPAVTDPFVGNMTYIGWLSQGGTLAGTVEVKAGKATSKGSKVTVTVTLTGGRKTVVYSDTLPVGGIAEAGGLTFGGSGVSGSVSVNGASYELAAMDDPLKSSDSAVKSAAKAAIKAGAWTFALDDGSGVPLPFSMTVAAKTGKAKLTGFLADGTKVSTSVQGVLADGGVLYVPVSYAKKTVRLAFLLTVGADGAATISGLSKEATASEPAVLAVLEDGSYGFAVDLAGADCLTTVDGLDVTPNGEETSVSNGKMKVVDKTVGSVKAKDGVAYVSAGSKGVSNLSTLKLSYAKKTGIVTGSFKLYRLQGGKLKKDTAKVYGIAIGQSVVGFAVVKGRGSYSVVIR